MDLNELAAQFGGKPIKRIEPDLNELAAQFGGKPVQESQDLSLLAAQFGGKPITSGTAPPAAPVATPETESFSTLRGVADVPLQTGKGVVSGIRMIADAFGAGSSTSKNLKSVEDYLAGLMSAQSKQDSQEIARIMKAAEDRGVLDQVKAGVKAFTVAPVDFLANALGTAAPAIVASLGATVLGPVGVVVAGAGTGLTMGAGVVKGSIYDAVKDELSKTNMPPDQVEARAQLAQEYRGKNLDMILTGMAIGTIGATTGVEPAIARQIAKGVLTKGAVKEELKNVAEEQLQTAAKRGVAKQAARTGAIESGTEFTQAGQEQLAQNIALQREGFDVPTMRGVVSQATLEGLAGLGLGTIGGGREASQAKGILTQRQFLEVEKVRLEQERITKEKEDAQAKVLPKDVDAILTSALDKTKITAKEETFDMPTSDEKTKQIADLEAKINERQLKLDAKTHPNMPAATISQARDKKLLEQLKGGVSTATPPAPPAPPAPPVATVVPPAPPAVAPSVTPTKESIYAEPIKAAQEKITALESGQILSIPPATLGKLMRDVGLERPKGMKGVEAVALLKEHIAKIGGQDATQQVDTTTTRDGTQILSGPEAGGPPAGTTPDGRPGVVDTKSAVSPIEDGAGAQQPALEDFSNFLRNKGIPVFGRVTAEDTQKDVVGPPTIGIQRLRDLEAEYFAELDKRQQGQNLPPVERQDLATQMQAALEKQQTETEAAETERQVALQQIAGENIPQTKTDADIREQYEKTRAKLKEQGVTVPKWGDLTLDERDKYLGVLPADAVLADYDKAAKTLATYREQKKGSGLKPIEQRIVNGYEESRANYQRALVIDLPAWNELSSEARSAYTSKVKNNTPIEQDEGFDAVAAQLEKEGKGIRGVSRTGVAALKLKGSEQEAQTRAQEELAKSLADRAQAVGKGKPLSNGLIMLLITGDVNGVLKQLGGVKAQGLNIGPQKGEKGVVKAAAERQSILTKLVSKFLAQALNTIKYSSNVVVADLNNEVIQRLEREGKLAEYDPKTDTFYFTEKGLDEATFLHEVVHAGTVKLIYQYLNNPSSLTENQRKALDHLQKIFDFSSKRLGGKFKNAYENLYEFVGYALTDAKFQDALAGMQARPLANYTTKAQDLWTQFTQVLANLYDLVTAKARTLELRPEIFDAFAKSLAPMNKEALYEETTEEGITTLEGEIATETDYAQRGAETELKEKKQKYKPGKVFLSRIPGYEGNLLLEVTEAFREILETPEAGIDVAPLAAKPPKTPPYLKVIDPYGNNPAFTIPQKIQKSRIKNVISDIFSYKSAQKLLKKLQNDRRPLVVLEKYNIDAGLQKDSGPNVNNIYGQITLALSRSLNKFYANVYQPIEMLQKATVEYAKTKEIIEAAKRRNEERKRKNEAELTVMEYIEEPLHIYAQAFTDQERRLNTFVQTAPLEQTNKTENINGVMVSPADLRELVFGNPTTKKAGIFDTDLTLTNQQARALYLRVEQLVLTTDANGKKIPNTKNVVPNGFSPLGRKAVDFRTVDGNVQYNATGFTYQDTEATIAAYEKDPNKAMVDKILSLSYELNKIAKELNKESNYLSKPASNWIEAYGYQRYVPLKGIIQQNPIAERIALNFNSQPLEKDLQDVAFKSEGRYSVSNNPILQSMSEAVISTVRAGKGVNYTLAIKNSAKPSPTKINGKNVDLNPNGQGLIDAKVVANIPFEERPTVKEFRKPNTVFHHNENGSIDVIEINDKDILESIRRTYKEQNKLVEIANFYTSLLGQSHTRYNFNFAPVNFVRDALTNAFNIGATYGASKSFELVANIADQIVTKKSLVKAWKIANAYKKPNFARFKNHPDPVYRTMYEYIIRGGMVEFLEGISIRSNMDKLDKELTLSKSRIVKTVTGLNTIIDTWTNMFEIASRSAAYGLLKDHFINVEKLDPESAAERAAAATKNLANFEQVGEYGKAAGAWFMFFRPSATGAAAALDAFAPALYNSLERAVKNAPENIKNNPKTLATFKEKYKFKQQAARRMTLALGGLGSLMYIMSYMMADDDEMGRNKTLTDDMAQWTRFVRFHVPGFDKPFLIPWGFGFGAFSSAGAQFTSVAMGHQSFGDALKNIVFQISLDSFVPLPVSRMDIADSPVKWFVDSISPSLVRPIVEFTMNKNGLGQSIYNDASGRRMGDAYMGGDHVPETYKIISEYLAELTEGYIDWTPNTTYFLVNSYADGPARVIDLLVNNYYFATGGRDWDPKTNVPLIGSFIGAPPNVDTKEFISVEKQIENIRATVNMFKQNRPDYYYSTYLPNNPFNEAIIKTYDQNISVLNKLRSESKIIRGSDATPKEQKQQLEANKSMQNIIKRNMIDLFESYEIKP